MEKAIYLDNGNVTRVADEVLDTMLTYYKEKFGVPGGEFGHIYEEEAGEALWKARETVARKINARPEEIVFTSGVTEGNNLAIKGVVDYMGRNGKVKIVTSRIERKCIMKSMEYLQNKGHETEFVDVDRYGFVGLDDVHDAAKGAALISIQHVNQEIGTIQDIRAIGDIAEEEGAIFHTDATHSFLKERIDVEKMKIDMMTVSGHVIHAPLGSGALFIREGVRIEPLFHGDQKEFGNRAGHPNIPAIMGLAKAIGLMKDEDIKRMRDMRDFLIKELLNIDDSRLNGPEDDWRVCDNVNISFRGVEGEAILMLASSEGLIIRTGSACFSPELKYSYVLKAMGRSAEEANSSTRLTPSRYTSMEELKKAVEILEKSIERLRSISPIYKKVNG